MGRGSPLCHYHRHHHHHTYIHACMHAHIHTLLTFPTIIIIILFLLTQLIKQAQEYQKQCEILTKQEAEMKSQVRHTFTVPVTGLVCQRDSTGGSYPVLGHSVVSLTRSFASYTVNSLLDGHRRDWPQLSVLERCLAYRESG